ncbi:MAG: anaerobic sulfatase maturase [Actinomycetaceae bacterium]|nr:anaerobic sulfatase maturase [Actinomycetaceae bacterium]
MKRLPFTVVTKPTGAACNLDCTYCFFLSKELLYDHGSQMMSPATLDTYIHDYLASQPDGPVTLIWQGGEPTLRGIDFFREAVRLANQYRRPSQQVSHAMQTNGTLLNDEWCEFLKTENFLVGISIDGPEHIHDAFRVNKAGRGTFKQVIRGWKYLQQHGVDTNILCTVHGANEDHGVEVYEFFTRELGAQFLQFIPIVERVPEQYLALAEEGWRTDRKRRLLYKQEGQTVTSRSVSPDGFGAFLSAIFDRWIQTDVGRVFVQHFDTMLGNLFGQHAICVHSPTCGNALAIEHNGDVYSCDHYVEPDYLLGNVTRGESFINMLTSPFQRDFGNSKYTDLPTNCQTCPVLKYCFGGCPKDRFLDDADGGHNLNYLCAGYYQFFSHAQPAMVGMGRLLRAGREAREIMNPTVADRVIPKKRTS